MFKNMKIWVWIVIVASALVAAGACVASFFILKEKKEKEQKELEEYLDYSIL